MPLITDEGVPKSKWKRYLDLDKKVVQIEREFPFSPSQPGRTPVPKLYDLFRSMPREDLYFYYCEKVKRTQIYSQALDVFTNLLCGILGGIAVLYYYNQAMWLIAVATVTVFSLIMIPVVKKREETLLDHREMEMMGEILGVEQYLSPHLGNGKKETTVEGVPSSEDKPKAAAEEVPPSKDRPEVAAEDVSPSKDKPENASEDVPLSKGESEDDPQKQSMKVPVGDTSLLDSLEVLKQEYQAERNKRQSFETRAGLIITVLAALCAFVFKQIKITGILALAQAPMTFFALLKILAGVFAYISFIGTLWCVFKTIRVRDTLVISTELFDSHFLGQPRLTGVWDLVDEYIKFVDQHREMNDNRATALQHSFYWICGTIVSVMIYINI